MSRRGLKRSDDHSFYSFSPIWFAIRSIAWGIDNRFDSVTSRYSLTIVNVILLTWRQFSYGLDIELTQWSVLYSTEGNFVEGIGNLILKYSLASVICLLRLQNRDGSFHRRKTPTGRDAIVRLNVLGVSFFSDQFVLEFLFFKFSPSYTFRFFFSFSFPISW